MKPKETTGIREMGFPPSLNVAFLSPFLAALVSPMCRPLGVLMFKIHTRTPSLQLMHAVIFHRLSGFASLMSHTKFPPLLLL